MLEKEKLHFKVGLSGSSDKKHPEFQMLINGQEHVSRRQLTGDANVTEYFEFDAEVEEGDCFLVIKFLNKAEHDTVLGPDGDIVEDLLLNIDSIKIDDIDLGNLLWTASNYKPDYFETYRSKMTQLRQELPESVNSCINLGWNGTWQLSFTSPFYIWLLENI